MAKLWQILIPTVAVLLSGCVGREPGVAAGDKMPGFAVASIKDPVLRIDSASYNGRAVLIDFWATWCPPCREELPHIEKLWKDNKDRGLVVMAVTTDDLATVAKFRAEQNAQLPMFLDEDRKMSRAFGITGLPTTIVVGKDGKVLYSSIGYDAGGDAELDAAVAQALL